jgi:hypothetical protein
MAGREPLPTRVKQLKGTLKKCRTNVNNGFAFVRLSVIVGTAASLVQGVLFGTNPIFVPGSGFNQAGVAQIVG